ncbi:hypothetical protein PybrP1_008759 [[Pythium] brassicae (nom. inval.)]|nr:hypothetical protein PybrP1_008759 [[Pythium] brassicae (nom. inval.)]
MYQDVRHLSVISYDIPKPVQFPATIVEPEDSDDSGSHIGIDDGARSNDGGDICADTPFEYDGVGTGMKLVMATAQRLLVFEPHL